MTKKQERWGTKISSGSWGKKEPKKWGIRKQGVGRPMNRRGGEQSEARPTVQDAKCRDRPF